MVTIERVGVLGCGLMGSGIAEAAAKAGYDTVAREVNRGLVENGRGAIERSLERAVKKDHRDHVRRVRGNPFRTTGVVKEDDQRRIRGTEIRTWILRLFG